MSAMYCGRKRDDERLPVRNLVLLTMPIDGTDTVYAQLLTAEEFDPEFVAERLRVVPGAGVDFANKLLKPVNNFWTTYRRLWDTVGDRSVRREAYQTMAKWVADNPPFPGRAYAQWVTWLYQDDALLSGRVRLRGRRVDLRRIDEPVLLVTAAGDHIAPRAGTLPFLETISSTDVTHFDRPGGHIGLIAGSAARKEIWPDLAAWLAVRSQPHTNGRPAR